MLRPLRVLLVVALVLLAAGVFTASAPADDDDDDGGGSSQPQLIDFTEGEGTAFNGRSTFLFSVTSGPNGEAASGFANLTNVAGLPFSGPATCLRVSGSRATFEIDNQEALTGFVDVEVFVGDFGAGGVPEVDEFNFHTIVAADGTCPDPASRSSDRTVDPTGDIIVRDNVAAPSGGDDEDDEDEDDDEDDEDD